MTGVPIESIVQPHHNNRRRPSIAEARPEIAVEWYYELNCGFSPNEFSTGSNVYAWWQCERDPQHIWPAQICKRCYDNRDCPFCFGKNLRKTPVIRERSLEFLYPELSKEWHKTRNGGLSPPQVLAGSHLKVWWKCLRNKRHVWQAVIKSRVAGRGCRPCYEETFLDLSDFPEILKLFDLKKNKLYDPHKLTTDMVLWWRCPRGPDHSWQSAFNKKSLLCKCCRNRQVSVTNSLATLYPKVAMQLHPTRNAGLTARDITANSSKKVWWRCPLNPAHVWQAVVRNRTCNGSRCPQCFNERRSNKKQRRCAT